MFWGVLILVSVATAAGPVLVAGALGDGSGCVFDGGLSMSEAQRSCCCWQWLCCSAPCHGRSMRCTDPPGSMPARRAWGSWSACAHSSSSSSSSIGIPASHAWAACLHGGMGQSAHRQHAEFQAGPRPKQPHADSWTGQSRSKSTETLPCRTITLPGCALDVGPD